MRKKVILPLIYTIMVISPMPKIVAMEMLQDAGANVALAGNTLISPIAAEIARRGEDATRSRVSRFALSSFAYGLRRAQIPEPVILSIQLLACPLVEEGISDPLVDRSRSFIYNVIDRMRLSPEEREKELRVQKHIEELRRKNYHYGKALFNLYKDYRNDSDICDYILDIKKQDVVECDEHYVKSLYKAWAQRRVQDFSEGSFLLSSDNYFVHYPLLLAQDAFMQSCMIPRCNRLFGITTHSYEQDIEHLKKTIDSCDQSKQKVYTAILERPDCNVLLPTIAQQNRQFGFIKGDIEYSKEQAQKLTRFFGDTRIQFGKLKLKKEEESENESSASEKNCKNQKLKDFFGINHIPKEANSLMEMSVKENDITIKPQGIIGFAQSVYVALSNSIGKVASIALIDIACSKIFLPQEERNFDRVSKSPEDILMESHQLVSVLHSVQPRCS